MKKKVVLIILVLILSVAGFSLAKHLQQKASNDTNNKKISIEKEKPKEEAAGSSKITESNDTNNVNSNTNNNKVDTSKSDTSNASKSDKKTNVSVPNAKQSTTTNNNNTSSSNKPNVSDGSTNSKPQTQKANMIIKDEITGKIITSSYVEAEGLSVADATVKVLDKQGIAYRVINSSTGLYFSSIAGIKERSAGSASGWCYYVNGTKPGAGASSFKLKKSDVVEWKFLENGF